MAEKWEACIHAVRSPGERTVLVDEGCGHLRKRCGKKYAEKKDCDGCNNMQPKSVIICKNSCKKNQAGKCTLKEIRISMDGECLSKEDEGK